LQIFGASVAIAIGLYLVLIVANIWSFFWFLQLAHDQLLNVSWSLDPYLVRALSYILAAAYFSLATTVIVAIATFKNKNFALWFSAACAGTCILLFLLSVASSHKRFFDESGNPMARYYRDPDTNCIELFFNKELRVHPTYNTELKWVTPDVVRDWRDSRSCRRSMEVI